MEFGDHHHHHSMHDMHDMHDTHDTHGDWMGMASTSDTPTGRPFCQNSDESMVMYMDGFRWTLGGGTNSCLNFFFGSWTLTTPPRFVAAMACVVAMGIATEGIRKWKHVLFEQARREHGDASGRSLSSRQQQQQRRRQQLLAWKHVGLQGLSILSAYLLMLVVMTYSIELLLCVVAGLMIGYHFFDGDSLRYGGGTPCCNFLEGSAETATIGGETSPMTEALLPTTTDDEGIGSSGHSCCNDNGAGGGNEEGGA